VVEDVLVASFGKREAHRLALLLTTCANDLQASLERARVEDDG